MGLPTKQRVYKYSQLLSINDGQFEEMLADEKALRELLKSNLVKK